MVYKNINANFKEILSKYEQLYIYIYQKIMKIKLKYNL